MSLLICFQRFGRIRRPFYRIIVRNKRGKVSTAPIDILGFYDPFCSKNFQARLCVVNNERLCFWLSKGAIVSPVLFRLLSSIKFFKYEKFESVAK